MSENSHWYVVHTYSGYENKVATNLEKIVENRKMQDLIENIMVPTETITEMKDNEKKEIVRKVFPGYVLIKMVMNDDTWYVVRNIRGVTGFVGPGSKPVPLSESEVLALGVEIKEITLDYAIGDNVKVTDGPLEGFIGTVDELELDKDRVRVIVSMFGRETPVELALNQVEPVE
ncbi:MAG: transcription termination/antitermination protein NusG [Clostridia bacterium]